MLVDLKKILLAILFVVTISAIFTAGTAFGGGLIEFKKAYTINSDDVCGDELCEKKPDKASSYQTKANIHTPLGQYTIGIPLDKIVCKEDMQFVVRENNWHPACVKKESVSRLIELGWAINPEDYKKIFETVTEKVQILEPLKQYQKEIPPQEVGLNITPDFVGEKRFLIFHGFGWHRLHNVEITISDQFGEIDTLLSQTSDRGILFMPWQVPDSITGGMYHVFATDGIHEYEIDMPVTAP